MRYACVLLALLMTASASSPTASPVLTAMRQELERSLPILQSQPTPPYFLSYQITETHGAMVEGEFGTISDIMEMMSLMSEMSTERRARGLLATYRVYPDGRQELVRRAFLNDFGIGAFKDIVAASNTPTVRTTAGFGGMPMGFAIGFAMPAFEFTGSMLGNPVSIAVPSLLFDDVSLTTGQGTVPHLPIIAPPT